jgi:hypothetical protein
VLAHRRQQLRQGRDVAAGQRLEELALDDLGVAGEYVGQQRPSGIGDRDRRPALVVRGRRSRDQPRLLEESGW